MRYTVLIATYNRASHLRETLRDLAQLRCSEAWEVLVVDNNSSDSTHDVVVDEATRFPVDLRYLFEPVQGKPAALNSGIKASRGEIICFIDDDMRAEPDWLVRTGEVSFAIYAPRARLDAPAPTFLHFVS